MRRIAFTILILALLLGLCACGTAPAAAPEVFPLPPPGTAGPLPEAKPGWAEDYAAFVERNYAALSEECYGAVAGVGFIDLDLDGTPELLLFDSGASASMGVQLFDLVDGQVTCVSASSVAVGEHFGGSYLSPLYVDTVYFEDFRLMEDADGRRWFQVLSRNGAENFYYNELIRFSGQDGVLTPESAYYTRVVTDPSTGKDLESSYTVGGAAAGRESFLRAQRLAEAAGTDTGYEAAGVFLWTDRSYADGYNGLMQMLQAAVASYVPIP